MRFGRGIRALVGKIKPVLGPCCPKWPGFPVRRRRLHGRLGKICRNGGCHAQNVRKSWAIFAWKCQILPIRSQCKPFQQGEFQEIGQCNHNSSIPCPNPLCPPLPNPLLLSIHKLSLSRASAAMPDRFPILFVYYQ